MWPGLSCGLRCGDVTVPSISLRLFRRIFEECIRGNCPGHLINACVVRISRGNEEKKKKVWLRTKDSFCPELRKVQRRSRVNSFASWHYLTRSSPSVIRPSFLRDPNPTAATQNVNNWQISRIFHLVGEHTCETHIGDFFILQMFSRRRENIFDSEESSIE